MTAANVTFTAWTVKVNALENMARVAGTSAQRLLEYVSTLLDQLFLFCHTLSVELIDTQSWSATGNFQRLIRFSLDLCCCPTTY
jgi:hypothetical protein